MKKFVFIPFIILCVFQSCVKETHHISVQSPDKNIEVVFSLIDGKPFYSVDYKNREVILPSLLGFEFKNGNSLDSNFTVKKYLYSSLDETWEQPWGEKREIRNSYNSLSIELEEKSELKRILKVIFRVYDDGIGFRYEIPEQENISYIEITDEKTEFKLTGNHFAWWIPAYKPERYEYLFKKSHINDLDTVHTPLTIETDEGYCLSVHEAALENYASMTLYNSDSSTLKCDLVPWPDGVKVKLNVPFQTPWRSIQIADTPGELITSYLILNLNEPNKLGDVKWVQPAKYVGIWWGMHIRDYTFFEGEKHGATTNRTKKYIDFAAEHGFDEVLVEGWNKGWVEEWWLDDGSDISFIACTPDFNLKEVQQYALSKNVRIQGYNETFANTENYLKQIDSAFHMYSSLGVKNVKIGQVGSMLNKKEWHHGQYGVNYYRYVLKKAAEYKLGVNFHEPIKGTGERRTYPNMLSSEGARGQEYNAWSVDGGNPPEHECILPFTRLLAGPMDFTPGIFDITIPNMPKNQVNTTLAKQLALYIVIYSPIQMAADKIENYIDQPAFQFIKDVPVDWEDTKVLNGEIGDYITIVRKDKNSDDWYLGAVTDENEREFMINLSFLNENIEYTAEIYADGDNAHYKTDPLSISIRKIQVAFDTTLNMKLTAGGGQVIRFKANK